MLASTPASEPARRVGPTLGGRGPRPATLLLPDRRPLSPGAGARTSPGFVTASVPVVPPRADPPPPPSVPCPSGPIPGCPVRRRIEILTSSRGLRQPWAPVAAVVTSGAPRRILARLGIGPGGDASADDATVFPPPPRAIRDYRVPLAGPVGVNGPLLRRDGPVRSGMNTVRIERTIVGGGLCPIVGAAVRIALLDPVSVVPFSC